MTQSKARSEIVEEHEESAADGLRYWTNSTIVTLGANFTVNMLLQAMKQLIEQVSRPDQIEQVETVITQQLNETYDYVRSKSPEVSSDLEHLQDLMDKDESKEAELDSEDTLSYMTSSTTKKILH